MPSTPSRSTVVIAPSVIPKLLYTFAPHARSSFVRFAAVSGSALTRSFRTEPDARSMPCASATFARCSA